MNELVEKDFNLLVDSVRPEQRAAVASLMDLIESYERGDFSRGTGELLPHLRRLSGAATMAVWRIFTYANEMLRVALFDCQHGSTQKETE